MKHEIIIQMETAIDHLTGEELGQALEALNGMPEVLDAIYLCGLGKKNRPAGLLQVLCREENSDAVCAAIFRHTHTLGIRMQKIERVVLPRGIGEEECAGESAPAKIYELEGMSYARPEADAAREIARKRKVGAPALRFARQHQKQSPGLKNR